MQIMAARAAWIAIVCGTLWVAGSQAITLPGDGMNDDPNMLAEPRVDFAQFSASGYLVRTMAGIHDRFGKWIFAKSAQLGCRTSHLAAILKVESGGAGFDSGGRMIIRFENHVFDREYNGNDFDDFFRYSSTKSWQGP